MSKSPTDNTKVTQNYVIYGSELSYFTRKLVHAMTWYFPTQFTLTVPRDDLIKTRAGTHQIPVLQTPQNWMIADSTPIIQMLDGRLTTPKYYPPGLVGAFTAIVEEYFDEWIPRLAIWSRWACGSETAIDASEQMSRVILGDIDKNAAKNIANWGRKAVRALGMDSKYQQNQGEKELIRIFTALDAQLSSTGKRFIFGNSPTAADCIVYGSCTAHFTRDIYPKQVLKHLTALHSVLQQASDPIENQTAPSPRLKSNEALPPFVDFVLNEASTNGFSEFLRGNMKAIQNGTKAFTAKTYGKDVSYLARPYPEQSRRMLRSFLKLHLARTCTLNEQERFSNILKEKGLHDLYLGEDGEDSKL